MFNKLEARVLSEYKRSRAAPSTFCTLIKHYFSFIKHYIKLCKPTNLNQSIFQFFFGGSWTPFITDFLFLRSFTQRLKNWK